jgi:hypothetical protein
MKPQTAQVIVPKMVVLDSTDSTLPVSPGFFEADQEFRWLPA